MSVFLLVGAILGCVWTAIFLVAGVCFLVAWFRGTLAEDAPEGVEI